MTQSARPLLIACMLACLHNGAMAFGFSPDGGAMLHHMEQGVAAHQRETLEGFPIEYYPSMRWNDNFSIQVDAVVVQGNAQVSDAVLQAALKVHVGKRISVQRLSTLTRLVEKAYREAGYRALAYVPEQSFARGKLVIQVIER